VGYAKFSFPTNLIANPADLPGRWLYISIEGVSNAALRASWRSTIESATVSGGKLLVTTQIRDANSSVWLQLSKVKNVGFEIVSQPLLQPRMMSTNFGLGALSSSSAANQGGQGNYDGPRLRVHHSLHGPTERNRFAKSSGHRGRS